jgi:hypothetical protein
MRSRRDQNLKRLIVLAAAVLCGALAAAGCELLGSGCANGICRSDVICDDGGNCTAVGDGGFTDGG